jgi:hypothetical protein
MTLINLDFNIEEVKDNFAPLPTDKYPCKFTARELKKSSAGNDMLAVEWTIMEGEHAGKKIFDFVTLNTDWKVKQYAELIGVTSGSSFDPDLFDGLEVIIDYLLRDQKPKEKEKAKIDGRDPDCQINVITKITVIGS